MSTNIKFSQALKNLYNPTPLTKSSGISIISAGHLTNLLTYCARSRPPVCACA